MNRLGKVTLPFALAGLAFSSVNAQAINLQTTLSTDVTIDEAQLFADKTIFFLMDVSGSITDAQRLQTMNGILDSLQTPSARNYFDAGNYYEMVFITFATDAKLEKVLIFNNYEDAERQLKELFFVEGDTPRYFAPPGGIVTRLRNAVNEVLSYMTEYSANMNEIDIVLITDGHIPDMKMAEDALNELIGTYDGQSVQSHCVIMSYNNNHVGDIWKSTERTIVDQWGGQTTISDGTCETDTRGMDASAVFLQPITAAINYTLG